MGLRKLVDRMLGDAPADPPRPIDVRITQVEIWDRARVEHLTLIQGVIGRLANNEFLVKGWAITVLGLFLGFAVQARESALALASIATTVLFWGLDGYYLYCERKFRDLYRRVQAFDPEVSLFTMDAMVPTAGSTRHRRLRAYFATLKRSSLASLYFGLVSAALVVAGLIGTMRPAQADQILINLPTPIAPTEDARTPTVSPMPDSSSIPATAPPSQEPEPSATETPEISTSPVASP